MQFQDAKQEPVEFDLKLAGAVIRQARENLRYSYRELAQKCHVSSSQLLRIESGEFEYSALKLFKVCVTLGLPMGDLVEYCTVLRAKPNVKGERIERKIEKLLNHGGPKTYTMRLEIYERFVSACADLAAFFLISSSPLQLTFHLHFPLPDMYESFSQLAANSEGLSNVERLAMLRALYKSPCEKLIGLGVIEFDDIAKAVEQQIDWRPDVGPIRSIHETLAFGDNDAKKPRAKIKSARAALND